MLSHGLMLLFIGLVVCAWAVWLFRERLAFSGALVGFPLLAIGLGLLIASSMAPSSPLSKVRGFGLIATLAYSLYLTHKEIMHFDYVFLQRYVRPGGWLALLIYFVSSFAVATVLYFVVERTFLRMREKVAVPSAVPVR
jgi:peptidoglycan/LPS O-acetylase OafA/YrhL